VANEKIKLIQTLSKDKYAILNNENPLVKKYSRKTRAKIVWYGKGSKIRAENQSISSKLETKFTLNLMSGKINVRLPLLGEQFISDSLAAAAVGYVSGVSPSQIREGLQNFRREEHRMVIIHHKSGAVILDDSYNNNPEAARGALMSLKSISGNKKMIVVFGDMLELGNRQEQFHRETGRLIASLGTDYLLGVGRLSKSLIEEAAKKMPREGLSWVENVEDAYKILAPLLEKDSVILIKGSRSIRLDKLVDRLSA